MASKILLVAARGDRGDQVRHIQTILQTVGLYRAPVDGIYGEQTTEAVRRFQRGWLVTGIVDAATWEALEQAELDKKAAVEKPPVPHGLIEIERCFGAIEYVEADEGRVQITNGFETERIVSVRYPVVGWIQCHTDIEAIVGEVLADIVRKNLASRIHSFVGYNARHKMHDPQRTLSTHSWGIAFDVNASSNAVGTAGDMHPEIIESFEAFGFQWGGRWAYKDPMHFQYATGY